MDLQKYLNNVIISKPLVHHNKQVLKNPQDTMEITLGVAHRR